MSHGDNRTHQHVQSQPVLKSLICATTPPAELVTLSLSPDLLPGEGLQVKLSISTASPLGL